MEKTGHGYPDRPPKPGMEMPEPAIRQTLASVLSGKKTGQDDTGAGKTDGLPRPVRFYRVVTEPSAVEETALPVRRFFQRTKKKTHKAVKARASAYETVADRASVSGAMNR